MKPKGRTSRIILRSCDQKPDMATILADSFTASLAKLANDEQKQAQLTAFTLMTEPDRPGLQFHRIDKSKDPNFWSVRVSRDIRKIGRAHV